MKSSLSHLRLYMHMIDIDMSVVSRTRRAGVSERERQSDGRQSTWLRRRPLRSLPEGTQAAWPGKATVPSSSLASGASRPVVRLGLQMPGCWGSRVFWWDSTTGLPGGSTERRDPLVSEAALRPAQMFCQSNSIHSCFRLSSIWTEQCFLV